MFIGGYVYKKWYKRFLAAILDIMGWLFLGILRLLKPTFNPSSVTKILVLRLDHLGDIVMTRPALRALREAFPKAQIDLIVSAPYASLFEDDSSISNVIPMQSCWFDRSAHFVESFMEAMKLTLRIQNEHYDMGIDFRGDLRNICLLFLGGCRYRLGYGYTGGRFMLSEEGEITGRKPHQIEQNLKLLERIHIHEKPGIEPFKVKGGRSAAKLPKLGENKSLVMIHPGSGDPLKRWSSNNFKKLIRALVEDSHIELIIIGTEEEKETLELPRDTSQITDLRGKTNLKDLPLLLDKCSLFLGNDSGPAHVAGAQGTESVLIFGGQNEPEEWKPRGNQVHLFEPAFDVSVDEVLACVQGILKEQA